VTSLDRRRHVLDIGSSESCGRGRDDRGTLRVEAHAFDLPAVDVVATEVDPLTTGIDARVRRARAHVAQHEGRPDYARLRVDRSAQDVRDSGSIRSPDEVPAVGTPIGSQIKSSVCGHLMHYCAAGIEYDDVVVRGLAIDFAEIEKLGKSRYLSLFVKYS